VTYGEIVRAQFAKHMGAVVALWVLLALFLLATYAPVLAFDVPFWTSLEGAPASPWLRSLFDPRVFPLDVDVFFNWLMATLPLLWALARFARGRLRSRLLLCWLLLQFGGFLVLSEVRADWRQEYRDWPTAVHEAKATAAWPPIVHHPSSGLSQFSLSRPLSDGTLLQGGEAPPRELWPYYLLGADHLGNDVFTRLLYGTRISLTIGILAVAIYVTIGIILGALAGYFGGWWDDFLMFVTQVVMTIPALFLILFILAVVDKPTIYHIMLVIGGLGWPGVMRLVRGEFLRQREIDYVNAARALGLGNRRIMFRHIVPNTMAPVLVAATFGVAGAILLESTLSFIGLGDPAAPSWGRVLQGGFESGKLGRHLVWSSGTAIFLTVLILNMIGEGLRDALDPKLRR